MKRHTWNNLQTHCKLNHKLMYYQTFDEHPLFLHRMPQGRIYIPWYSDYLPPSTWLYFEKKRLYLTLLTVEGKFYTNFNLVSCQSFLVTYALLTHYSQVLLFDTPWKHQKNFRFSDVFRGYIKAAPGCNGLTEDDVWRLLFDLTTHSRKLFDNDVQKLYKYSQ